MNKKDYSISDRADGSGLSRRIVFPQGLKRFATVLMAASGFVWPCIVPAQISQIYVEQQLPGTIKSATGQDLVNFPGAFGFSSYNGSVVQRKVLAGWAAHRDGAPVADRDWAMSSDGGKTFGATVSTPGIGSRVVVKRRSDGALLSFLFRPDSHPTSSTFNHPYFKSTNGGSTWSSHTAVLDFGTNDVDDFYFHRDIIEENDGSLYAVGYGTFTGQANYRVMMVKSTDGGANWDYLSTLAYSSTRGYNESTLVRCANGSWLAISRTSGPDTLLRYKRSTNQGVSWFTDGASAVLPGMTTATGVDPALMLMPNGVLVLSWGPENAAPSGSRDIHLAFSEDGNGTTWSNETVVFVGDAGVAESSGYTAVPAVSAHRFLQISDTGASWSYPSPYASPNPFSMQGKFVDIVRTNEINRIDLQTKLASGLITMTTDLTYTDSGNQESRPSGAVDGSTDYWSGAFKNATSGSYTIDLQQNTTLNRVGVCLHYNTSQSATLEYSTNGSTWTTFKTYTNATHRALDYTSLTPFSARYIRVSVTRASAPVCLNELELYTDRDTFENNAVKRDTYPHGTIPPGYAAGGTSGTQYGFAVRDSTANAGYQSSRALQLYDGSSTWQAGIRKTSGTAQSKTLEFRIKPQSYGASPSAILFSIKGTVTTGTDTVFYFRVSSDGSLAYNDGANWNTVTGCGAGTIPTNAWTLVRVVATRSPASAAVTINGVAKGSATMYATPANVTALKDFAMASAGTAPWGEKALFDDIYYQ